MTSLHEQLEDIERRIASNEPYRVNTFDRPDGLSDKAWQMDLDREALIEQIEHAEHPDVRARGGA